VGAEELTWLLQPWALGLLGLCIGSFLNVVAHRMPAMMERQWWADLAGLLGDRDAWQRSHRGERPAELDAAAQALSEAQAQWTPMTLSSPGSRCPACGHRIRWFENIPVLSYLWLRGRCSACGTRISWRYPAVEAATGLLFLAIGLHHGATWAALCWCGVAAVLVAAALIDWDTTLLPDDLTLPLLWAGLLAAWWGVGQGHGGITLNDAVLGAALGYGSLWLVATVFRLITGKQGMGHGDFKLLGALGAWLGPTLLIPIVLLSSLLGAVIGLWLKTRGGLREGRYLPFGPFLAGAGLLVIVLTPAQVARWLWGA
jgi:leader peptidase (prepilin peptidase) / N-methyltransferase